MIAYAFLQHRRSSERSGKKESTDHTSAKLASRAARIVDLISDPSALPELPTMGPRGLRAKLMPSSASAADLKVPIIMARVRLGTSNPMPH